MIRMGDDMCAECRSCAHHMREGVGGKLQGRLWAGRVLMEFL
jgi:hypothetical protein